MRFKRIDNIGLLEDNNIYGIFCGNEKKLVSNTNFIQGLKKLHCDYNWVHANPSQENIIEVSNYYFFKTPQIENFLEQLKEKIIQKQNLIFILGRRGSGKTFIQNYFLNTQTRDLNDKKITWLRVDITKIYTAKTKHSKTIKIQNYLWAQIVFVYLRYSKERPQYGIDKVFANIRDRYHEDLFKDIFASDIEKEKYIAKIENTSNNNDGITGKPFDFKETEIIAKRILQYSKESDQSIFLIMDGIDNIDFYYLHRKNLIAEFIAPILDINNEYKYFSSLILSFRSELNLPNTLQETYENQIAYIDDTRIPTIDFNSYWKWFVGKIDTMEDEYKERYFGTKNIDNNLLKEFKDYLENVNDIVKSEFQRLNISEALLDNFNILEYMYDKDIREMRENILSSYIYVKEFIKNYNSNKEYQQQKQNINMSVIFKNMQYIIIEALFKNGMRYAPDVRNRKYTPPYRNLGFTNIFHPTEKRISERESVVIPPLLYVYLLKYLSRNGATYGKIIDDFKQYLAVEFSQKVSDYIRQAFEELLEYNYVTYSYDNQIETLEITTKGKIVLDITFKNIDVFHANIYFSIIDSDTELKFNVFDMDGKKYITTTLQNVVKYLHFLMELQEKMLSKDINNNPLKIDIITNEMKKSYRKLYIIENKPFSKLSIEETVKPTFDLLVSDINNCLDLIKKKNLEDIIKYIQEYLPDLNLESKSFIIFDIVTYIQNLNDQKAIRTRLKESLYLPWINDYLSYTQNEKLVLQILDDYVDKTIKFKFISILCDAMYNNR